MIERDKFKNSPLHDKEAIINLIDKLNPEQMIKVVDFLMSITEEKKILEPEDVEIAVICLDRSDFANWKEEFIFSFDNYEEFFYDNVRKTKVDNKTYYCITKIEDTKSKMFDKIEYTHNARYFHKDFSEIQTLLTLNLK